MDPSEIVGLTPDPLAALVYTSVPTGPLHERDLTDLLFGARRFNATVEVTGRLLVLEHALSGQAVRFLQWIEGTAAAVDVVFARIEADPRHTQIQVIRRGPIAQRSFPEWEMALGRTWEAAEFDVAVAALGG